METSLIGERVKLCYGKPDGEPRSTTGIVRAVSYSELNGSFILGIELLDMAKGSFVNRKLIDTEMGNRYE